MPWIVFALISITLLSSSNILQRVLMKDEQSDAYAYTVVFQFFCGILTAIFAILKGLRVPNFEPILINLFIMAAFYGLGSFMLFKALQFIEASEATIITSVRSLITIISSVILLHENFNLIKMLGALLIISAILIISLAKSRKFKFNQGILYALGMALFFGLAVTNDAFILKHQISVYTYAALSFLLPGTFLVLAKPKVVTRFGFMTRLKTLRNMILSSLFYSGAAIAFFSALGAGANASQLSPINQSAVILTILLAALFLDERDHLVKKFISAILVVIGVYLLK